MVLQFILKAIKMNNDNSLNAVILDGMRFLESITRHYGSDKGMEVWETMGQAMGQEVKGKIFFAMLTGETSGRVRMTVSNAAAMNPVSVIKTIREYTGLGLKDAKDLWDASKISTQVITVDPNYQRDFANDLRKLGCIVS